MSIKPNIPIPNRIQEGDKAASRVSSGHANSAVLIQLPRACSVWGKKLSSGEDFKDCKRGFAKWCLENNSPIRRQ